MSIQSGLLQTYVFIIYGNFTLDYVLNIIISIVIIIIISDASIPTPVSISAL